MAEKRRQFPYRKNGRFLNYPGEERINFMGVVRWCMRTLMQDDYGEAELRRLWVQKEVSVTLADPDQSSRITPTITWIGHSTFLIQIAGLAILTDPIFWSPSLFFPRLTRPGLMPDKLPPIDIILISHNHPDHMDIKSLRRIVRFNPAVKILVPWGDKRVLERRGFIAVSEYMWWDDVTIKTLTSQSVVFTFLPAAHDTRRSVFDANKSLWGSWMINGENEHIYFAGDSAADTHYREIGKNFPQINTALMPIGPCDEKERTRHLSAEDACEAFLELGAYRFVPMHWGTFHFGDDHPLIPIKRLQAWWENSSDRLSQRCLDLLKIGQTCACARPLVMPSIQQAGVAKT